MKHDNVRDKLIESTIRSIAVNGLDKTTTKAIAAGAKVNEAYIYSHFADKEALLVAAFDRLDDELMDCVLRALPAMRMRELVLEDRCRIIFSAVWRFVLNYEQRCLAFIRYFYSPYFTKYSVETHRLRCQPVLEQFKKVFKAESDIWMILNHVLNVLLDFAIKVFHEQMSADDNYVEHVFLVIYRSIEPYFSKEEVQNNE